MIGVEKGTMQGGKDAHTGRKTVSNTVKYRWTRYRILIALHLAGQRYSTSRSIVMMVSQRQTMMAGTRQG